MGNKIRYIGVLLIAIMFFSTFAFAIINSVLGGSGNNQQPSETHGPSVQKFSKRLLSSEEKAFALKNGATVMEFLYNGSCADKCQQDKSTVEGFFAKYNPYLVLSEAEGVPGLELMGGTGQIRSVENVTDKSLLDAFCEVAALKPKDCVLKDI